jgi:hypothetical protein
MAYTPELSVRGSATLRRLAWGRGQPMTKTLENLIEATAIHIAQISPWTICVACKDQSNCLSCAFNPTNNAKKGERT